MASPGKEIEKEVPTYIRVYKDGSVERLRESPIVPPSPQDPETGVSSKDITISENPLISARVYLPKSIRVDQSHGKLPILVYFHGGGFFFESAFTILETTLMNRLVSEANFIAVSVEYRLAPEYLLPVAYDDCFAAVQWAASHAVNDHVSSTREPWLSDHGDFERLFLGGDSAGANIVHNVLVKAGSEALPGGVKILGAFLSHPYFWSSKPAGLEHEIPHQVWNFVYPSAPGGVDNPMVNPMAPEAPSLAALGCSRLLVTVASVDILRDRGISYYEAVKKSGWKGVIELIEVEGEEHAFHILKYGTEGSINLIKRIASFLQN